MDLRKFLIALLNSYSKVLLSQSVPRTELILVETNLRTAFNELRKDIAFLQVRRNCFPSSAKISGCIVFRLIKHQVFNWTVPRPSFDKTKLPITIALHLVMETFFLDVDLRHPLIRRSLEEIYYLIMCRHTNQENLALIFDGIGSINEALKNA